METTVTVDDHSRIAEVRRAAALLGQTMGLSPELIAQASLVTSELCTNILKYAERGEVWLSTLAANGTAYGLDIVALDRGPGIANFAAAAKDGFSTGGSLGIGLGTMRRAAALFDIYTAPGLGTAVLVRLQEKKLAAPGDDGFVVGSRMTPIRGEIVSGDSWSCLRFGPSIAVTVVDGLGHGPKAAEAAHAAIETFHRCVRDVGPAQVVQLAHQALLSTRGAVMAVACIDGDAQTLRFAGLGNISAVVHTQGVAVRLSSSDGTVGYGVQRARESSVAWVPRSTLILNTDGLSSRWSLARHPGLLACHPLLIAAVLHRDFARNTDDATVVVIQGQ
ncbi:SpoIIE family protein phosphatase [Ideonella azotifigens]|uniref:Anti-sigma regulatory factor n=1 Tax=Ideonella azotifigens TaxID=513160 RepID=A0ABN1KK12_9BURK|nr:SpoIIE family protein phosphatase [Ideonella azotifigens]MCD2339305.1 SpoIIE family protein phosphatase [Ideonella azotifigens]